MVFNRAGCSKGELDGFPNGVEFEDDPSKDVAAEC